MTGDFGGYPPSEVEAYEPTMPCCDYRDHSGFGCACPEHEWSEEHPFGSRVSS